MTRCLRDLSAHLQEALRDSDTSARLGGDEFLIVARRAHADPLAVAQRVINGWRSANHAETTLSAGVALHRSALDPDQTFERADKALLQAKAAGKNQAKLYSGD
ncbi:MAG: diguanylate cyclase [Acidimicrobiales bacterium]